MKKKAKELNDFLNNMVKEGKIKKNNFETLLSDIQNVGKEPIQVIGDNLNKVLNEIKETFTVRPSKIEYTRVDAIEQATIYFEPDITIGVDFAKPGSERTVKWPLSKPKKRVNIIDHIRIHNCLSVR